MHQEANNNVNTTVNQISVQGKEGAQVLASTLQQFMNSNVQIVCNDTDKLNKLYLEFGEIVNSFDSIFYISNEDREKLKSCVERMKLFEDDFKEESEDGKIYYNNLFILLLRLDVNLFIQKYENSPDYIKSDLNNKYLYSVSLFEIGKKDEAIKIIDEIISIDDNDKYFIQKCYFLFIDGQILELKKVLGKRITKNDKIGYYGVFELETLFLKEKRIKSLKKLNRKYKNKPLYHLRMAEIIYEIDHNQGQEINDNMKQAFINIADDDMILMKLIDTAVTVKHEDYLLKLLNGKKYSSLLVESRLLELLIYKENKSEEEITRIEEILEELKNTDLINLDNVNAVLSLNLHKELEAIDFFKKSYAKNKTLYTASNLLNLILKNSDARNFDNIQDYINTLSASTKASDFMLISSAYLALDNPDLALENAYIGAILSQNNTDFFMRFWAVHTKCDSDSETINIVNNQCVIEMSNSDRIIKICMDKEIPNKFNITSFHGVKFNNDKTFELNVIGKCVGDEVSYNNSNYKIQNITYKYDYFLKLIFPKINDDKYFKTITNNDGEDPLKEIREFLIEERNVVDKYFETYDLERTEGNGLPLSFFVNNEDKTYRDILLTLLYTNDDYKLYAGELNILADKKFVIDITSLVMLEQFDLLSKLVVIKDNIYVTQSTINTITKTFNFYLKNKKETLSVFADENGDLRKHELTEKAFKELQEFWRNILEVVSNFNVVNHESSLDKSSLESCQIDTIDYSIKNNCTLVAEDLLLKRVAYVLNNNTVNSTNFLAIVEKICSNAIEYIDLINTLSKGKYLYCISEISLLKMLLYSLVNKDAQDKLLEIIDNIFSTKFLYYTYLEIVIRVILYIYYYEEIDDKLFYIKLIDKIRFYCDEYKNNSCIDMLDKIKRNIENEISAK